MGSTNIVKSLVVALMLVHTLPAEAHHTQGASGCGGEAEFNCMVATINGEARGESDEGMLIVGKALKTRKIRGYIGRTICGISRRSFAPRSLRSTGTTGNTRTRIINAARAACASGDAGITHFHSFKNRNATSWARQFEYVGKVGGHWLFNAPMGVRANFDGFFAEMPFYDDENFFSESDLYYLSAPAEEAAELYTAEDDAFTEEILAQPVDDSISI